jgi:hypothetical protein
MSDKGCVPDLSSQSDKGCVPDLSSQSDIFATSLSTVTGPYSIRMNDHSACIDNVTARQRLQI